MTRRWVVRPLAQADIDAAVMWYEQRQSGLGSRFLDVLDRVFERIRDTPLQFPTIAVDVRRGLLHTFPYAVYFRETEQAWRSCICAAILGSGDVAEAASLRSRR